MSSDSVTIVVELPNQDTRLPPLLIYHAPPKQYAVTLRSVLRACLHKTRRAIVQPLAKCVMLVHEQASRVQTLLINTVNKSVDHLCCRLALAITPRLAFSEMPSDSIFHAPGDALCMLYMSGEQSDSIQPKHSPSQRTNASHRIARLASLVVPDENVDISGSSTTAYIGSAIKVLRTSLFKSQDELASYMSKEIGTTVGQGYVSRVEAGSLNISWERLEVVSKFLGCSPEKVLEVARHLSALAMEVELHGERDLITKTLNAIAEFRATTASN